LTDAEKLKHDQKILTRERNSVVENLPLQIQDGMSKLKDTLIVDWSNWLRYENNILVMLFVGVCMYLLWFWKFKRRKDPGEKLCKVVYKNSVAVFDFMKLLLVMKFLIDIVLVVIEILFEVYCSEFTDVDSSFVDSYTDVAFYTLFDLISVKFFNLVVRCYAFHDYRSEVNDALGELNVRAFVDCDEMSQDFRIGKSRNVVVVNSLYVVWIVSGQSILGVCYYVSEDCDAKKILFCNLSDAVPNFKTEFVFIDDGYFFNQSDL
jgi:hypothetical protein